MNVDRPLERIALDRAIQRVEQNLARQYSAFRLDQRGQQPEFGRRQGDWAIAATDFQPVEIDRQVAVLDRAAILRPAGRSFRPAQDRLYADDELGGGEGLDQVVVGAFVDAVNAVGG